MNSGQFKKGWIGGPGRPKKKITLIKDFVKANPYAVEVLMQTLYDLGIKGDRESAMYIIDRIKGKPKSSTDIKMEGIEKIGTGFVVELYKLMAQKRLELIEGERKQITGTGQGS